MAGVSSVFTHRRLLLATLIAGLLLIALQGLLLYVGPVEGCAGASLTPPMVDFQLASSKLELESVFGVAGSPCRTHAVDAFRIANTIDLFVYMPTYLIFLLSFFSALRLRPKGWAAWVGIASALSAAICDLGETIYQLRITAAFPGQPEWLAVTWLAATAKWSLLAISGIAAGVLIGDTARTSSRLLGALPVLGGAVSLLALVDSDRRALLAAGIMAGWLAIILAAATSVLARRRRRAA